MRITRPQMFMEIAHTVSKRATCMRLSVGAVLVKQRSIVSIGYNGVPSGKPHCQGNECPGKHICSLAIHAEINALHHLPARITGPLDLYVTDSPCETCYNTILVDGRIERLFFSNPYRIIDHLNSGQLRLFDNYPAIYRITPSGYIMDWFTKELVDVET